MGVDHPLSAVGVIDLAAAGGRVLGFSGLARVTVERIGDQS
jgi:hypothetical protein